MTNRVQNTLSLLRSGEYKKERIQNDTYDLTELYLQNPMLYPTAALEDMLEKETPHFLSAEDEFGFRRSLAYTPYYFLGEKKKVYLDGNIVPNYRRIISRGFDGVRAELDANESKNGESLFYDAMRRNLFAIERFCERTRKVAEAQGRARLADALSRIPRRPAESFYEACLFLHILIFALRCAAHSHLTLGRFDQYMLPYFRRDLARGVTRDELFETLELFFLCLNADSDIYFGVQQGDNGQSMVLGGFDEDGNDTFNELSELCLEASCELCLIDPKINLRVGKKSDPRIYELGTKLTKRGLGFPQYCNDDVIIPYLKSLGYTNEDAHNYALAACWEVISSNNGFDIPNMKSFVIPAHVNEALYEHLSECQSFDEFLSYVSQNIRRHADATIESLRSYRMNRGMHTLSLLVDGCIERGLDFSEGGAKYNNYGAHGVGISNATDSLVAVKKAIFEEKIASKETLLAALKADFKGYEELREQLLTYPKLGNNDAEVNEMAAWLIREVSDAFHGKDNGHGGVWRIGTGSAQSYATHAKDTGATADGRLAGDYYACSFSPAITTRVSGPLSVLLSFATQDISRIGNGGPLTMELHDTVFRNPEGEAKVAMLVKTFVELGGHQLQLNAINRDRLLDAQAHPEQYRNLIVRVWGWSGYFCELDKIYQDHIIRRTEFSF